MHIDDLDTPFVAIDLDVVEINIRTTQEYFDRHGIRFRPHIKTHKLPIIAHKQIAAGAKGIACQKLGEAEVMAAAGIDDIFIAYNIIGAAKLTMMIRTKRTIAASAMRFRSKRRPARRQGLLPEISLALSPGARVTSGSGS